MTFDEAVLLTRSEKITLVTCQAEQLAKLFTVHSGSVYKRTVDYFVSSVKTGGTALTKVGSIAAIIPGTFFYDVTAKTVYLECLASANPKVSDISIVYKFFFSSAPLNLPYDLNDGATVEWLPYVNSIGSIGQQLDNANTGIVLESSSRVDLMNNHGFFDAIFDKLIWENKTVEFYSWFSGLPITEARKIFEGVIESKDFASDKVTFNVKDFVFRLKNKVNLGEFSDSDGVVLDSHLGKPKRRIYGRADKCQAVGIDCVKIGYDLTGTTTIANATKEMIGTSTAYLSELSPGDDIIFTVQNEEIKYTIDSIASNTSAFISRETEQSITNLTAKIRPAIPYRMKNRRWHLAGHKLTSSIATIQTVINSRQFVVDTNEEFFQDDYVTINGISTQVTRKSGSQVILEQSIFPVPIVGDTIVKVPVLRSYFGNNRLILDRDFTLTNTTEAIIELDPLAEFNIAKERATSFTLTFTNGSSNITTASAVDLRTIIKPRDWIRKLTQSSDVWFEVLSVEAASLKIRTNFTQTTGTEAARIKNVEIIDDESLITADCYGLVNSDSQWVKTASDAVKHLVGYDAGFDVINETSFNQAKADCRYVLSMVIPEAIGGDAPLIRDVITKINESVFGSLYGNSSQEICFSIVNSRRPTTLSSIKDDDIISWSSESINSIVSDVKINYSPFTDTTSGGQSFKTELFGSGFVDKYIKILNTEEKTSFIYEPAAALVVAQRSAFYKALSTSVITIQAKAIFFNYSVNDRIYIELDRLYKRYGSSFKRKIGVVSGIKKGQYDSEIVLNDLGNIFNRCPTIAENSTLSFLSSSDDDKLKFGFILDNETLTPDVASEDELGNCLIG